MKKEGDFIIEIEEKPKIKEAILVEGLPGIGQVGEIAAKYLAEKLNAKRFATIYSYTFPPQVLIKKSGIIEPMVNELFYYLKKSGEGIIIVTGNTQSATNRGQYKLCEHILDITQEFKLKKIFTLGGFGVGVMPSKPKVFGAATREEDIQKLKNLGVEVERTAVGSIVGASGLLLALGRMRKIEGICLMGETSGFYPDPKAAKAVLRILVRLIDVEISLDELEKKAKEFEKVAEEAKEIEKKILGELGILTGKPEMPPPEKDRLRYIG